MTIRNEVSYLTHLDSSAHKQKVKASAMSGTFLFQCLICARSFWLNMTTFENHIRNDWMKLNVASVLRRRSRSRSGSPRGHSKSSRSRTRSPRSSSLRSEEGPAKKRARKEYTCDICHKTESGPSKLQEHFMSKQHIYRVGKYHDLTRFYCCICERWMMHSASTLESHFISPDHIGALEELLQAPSPRSNSPSTPKGRNAVLTETPDKPSRSRRSSSQSRETTPSSRSSLSVVGVKEASTSYNSPGRLICGTCLASFTAVFPFQQHLYGHKHLRKIMGAEPRGFSYYCSLCKMKLFSKKDACAHSLSLYHLNSLAEFDGMVLPSMKAKWKQKFGSDLIIGKSLLFKRAQIKN